jgi:hypothetical protein
VFDELVKSPLSIDPDRVRQGGWKHRRRRVGAPARGDRGLEAKATPGDRRLQAVRHDGGAGLAGAHKEGGFLGIGGKQVSDAGIQALDEISTALGTPPAA